MSCNCTESKMCLACGPAKSAKHRPSDTGGAIPARHDAEYDAFCRFFDTTSIACDRWEGWEARAALASKGDTGGDLSAEQAAFEKWSADTWKYNLRPALDESLDTYMEGETETAWMGWQARAALAAPRAAIPARDAVLEEAAQAVVSMGSTDPIMSYGQLCAAAIRKLKGVAAIPEAQPVEGCKTDFNKGWSLGFNACRDIVMAASAGGNNLPAIPEARGLTHAADYIDRQAESYMQENARADYDTGAAEWRNDECRDHYYAMSELADEIRNLTPASLPAIPEAGQSVPCHATPEMIAAAEEVDELYRRGTPQVWGQVWSAMLAAAPSIASMSADASPQKKEST